MTGAFSIEAVFTNTPNQIERALEMNAYLKAAATVAASLVVIGLIQKNVMSIPVVGEFLPGYTPKA